MANLQAMTLAVGVILWVDTEPDSLGDVVLIEKRNSDSWVLPGGKVDPTDDSVIAAAIRETQEECGIILQASQLSPVAHWHEGTYWDKVSETTRPFAIVYVHARLTPQQALGLRNAEPDKHHRLEVTPVTKGADRLSTHDRNALLQALTQRTPL